MKSHVRRLSRHRSAMIGLLGLALVILATVLAPVLSPYDPVHIDVAATLEPPGPGHLLGTDQFGRDILSHILYGGRLSLLIGVVAVAVAGVLGVSIGLVAGYFGGWVDLVVLRVVDILMAFPGILMALSIAAILGQGPVNVAIAVGISQMPTYIRLMRGLVLSLKQNTYVEASRALGCSSGRIMFRHLLPNAFPSVIVLSTVSMAWAIITGASLSFLGLGPARPTPEWGLDLAAGRDFLGMAWWITTFPGVAIMITILAVNLLGDGLRDILDPRMQNIG